LGGNRRLTVRLRHHFAPEYRLLQQLCQRPLGWLSDIDHTALQEAAEELHLYEFYTIIYLSQSLL
jgi:hypothetical protein